MDMGEVVRMSLLRKEWRRMRHTLANEISLTDDLDLARSGYSDWLDMTGVVRASGCTCADCSRALRVAVLAADGYRARYLELLEVS